MQLGDGRKGADLIGIVGMQRDKSVRVLGDGAGEGRRCFGRATVARYAALH